LRERYVKRILPASGGCSIVACGKGGRRDDAAGTKQASTAEVEEVDFRAGAEARCTPMTRFVEVKLAGAEPECPATEAPRGGDGRVEILLKNGRSLRVGRGFDTELVRALVAVVESAA